MNSAPLEYGSPATPVAAPPAVSLGAALAALGVPAFNVAKTLLLIGLAFYVAHEHYSRPAAPVAPAAVDAATLGSAYAADLASSYGDGCLAAAKAIDDGKTMEEAMAATQDAFARSRTAAFEAKVAPELYRVIPEGTEPTAASTRVAVSAFFRDFARGVKGGK